MTQQDYLDNLETFIHNPESVGLDINIIPVAMWLRGFMPAEQGDTDIETHSSAHIAATLSDMAEVSVNEVSRLMVLNCYALAPGNTQYPEWAMKPIS